MGGKYILLFFLTGHTTATVFLFLYGFLNFDTSQLGINENTSAVFAYNHFLMESHIKTTLGRNLCKTTTAGITV